METATYVIVAAIFLMTVLIVCSFRSVQWLDKWPPIDDDEFMDRCKPGTNREIALKVRRIVSEQLGIEYDRVYPEQNFVDDLGCD